jgi:hypothetical protein
LFSLLLDQFTHLALCFANIRMRLCDDCNLLVDVAGKLLDLSFGVHRTSLFADRLLSPSQRRDPIDERVSFERFDGFSQRW